MERLTFKGHDGGLFVKEHDIKTCNVEDEILHTGNAIRKLAEYEDTGLTPTMVLDTIKSRNIAQKQAITNAHIVDDYRKAEEQGLLLRLPCKVGELVYVNGIL